MLHRIYHLEAAFIGVNIYLVSEMATFRSTAESHTTLARMAPAFYEVVNFHHLHNLREIEMPCESKVLTLVLETTTKQQQTSRPLRRLHRCRCLRRAHWSSLCGSSPAILVWSGLDRIDLLIDGVSLWCDRHIEWNVCRNTPTKALDCPSLANEYAAALLVW